MRKLLIGSGAVVAIAAATVIAVWISVGSPKQKPAEPSASSANLIRDDSHYLDKPSSAKVTVVEFLDFECEACGLMYPYVEDARKKYAGKINYVVRYFPIPSHQNAQNAAIAVEAAAQQGQFESMYSRMFESQKSWGEKQTPQTTLFRSFAGELSLDMRQFDADVASSQIRQRVLTDQADGSVLGVTGTPTFFIDGQRLALSSVNDLDTAISKALANAS